MNTAITSAAFVVLGVVASASVAQAQDVPSVPNRPSATLLLPYFEVDLEDASGMNTVFSINNASATAILTHVVVWSDLGVPVFGFNVYLTGYDIQTVDMRALLTGTAPRTASDGQDPPDTISPQGLFSQDINFASCTGQLPPPPVPVVYTDYLRSALTGGASSFHGGRCVGRNLGTPNLARGHVTMDTVNNCTLRFPGDAGYFGFGGTGDATNQNTLWGDYYYIQTGQGVAFGDALVHIQASVTNPETSVAGEYTFYGRLTGWNAADNREPLSTTFATRFLAPQEIKGEDETTLLQILPTDELVVWRDPKALPNSFVCSSAPAWFPLGQEQIRAFDEAEESELPTFTSGPFPGAAQRVPVSAAGIPLTIDSGWLFLNLNAPVAPGANPPEDALAAQAWVTVLHRVLQGANGGRYDVGFRAIRLDTARDAVHATIF